MALPQVHVSVDGAGTAPQVTVDGHLLPGVSGFYVRAAAGQVPVVGVEIPSSAVTLDLPAAVEVHREGAAEFVAHLDPKQLESDALQHLGDDALTTGEGFVAALRHAAARWDTR